MHDGRSASRCERPGDGNRNMTKHDIPVEWTLAASRTSARAIRRANRAGANAPARARYARNRVAPPPRGCLGPSTAKRRRGAPRAHDPEPAETAGAERTNQVDET